MPKHDTFGNSFRRGKSDLGDTFGNSFRRGKSDLGDTMASNGD